MSMQVIPIKDGVKFPPLKILKYQETRWNGFKIVALEKRYGRKYIIEIRKDVQITMRKMEKLPTIKELKSQTKV